MRIASSPPDSHSVFNISGCFLRHRTHLRTRVRHRITSSMIPGVGPAFPEPARRRALPPDLSETVRISPGRGSGPRPRTPSPRGGRSCHSCRLSRLRRSSHPGAHITLLGRNDTRVRNRSIRKRTTLRFLRLHEYVAPVRHREHFLVPLRGNTLSASMRRLASLTHFRRSARLRVKCPGTARRYPGKPL